VTGHKNWVLVVSDGDDREVIVPVTERVMSIGRASESSLRLTSAGVSRNHAVLDTQGEFPLLTDQGSTNGTTVGGRKISGACVLKSGDVLAMGNAKVRLVNVDNANPSTAVLPRANPPENNTSQSFRNIKGNVLAGDDGMQNVVDGDNYAIKGHGSIHADHSRHYANRDSYVARRQHFNDNSSNIDFEYPESIAIRRGGLGGALTVTGLLLVLMGMGIGGYSFVVAFIASSNCRGPGCSSAGEEAVPLLFGQVPLWVLGAVTFFVGAVIYATGVVVGNVAESREKAMERRRRAQRYGGRSR
jgi:hypothetical protein